MDYTGFAEWLSQRGTPSGRAINDVLARCKRVETHLGTDMERLVSSPKALEKTLKEIPEKVPPQNPLSSEANLKKVFSTLKSAVRKAYAFVNQEE